MWCVLARWWKLNASCLSNSSWYNTLTATFLAVMGGQFTADTSCRRFVLYLRFWNQIFTWVSVSFNMAAKPARSGPERYFCWLNRRSSSKTCACEKAARERFFRSFDPCLFMSFTCSVLFDWLVGPKEKEIHDSRMLFVYIIVSSCITCKSGFWYWSAQGQNCTILATLSIMKSYSVFRHISVT